MTEITPENPAEGSAQKGEQPRTLFHIEKLLASGSQSPEEISKLVDELREKTENYGGALREMISFAFKNKNFEVMQEAIRIVENLVQGRFRTTPTSDRNIQDILERGEGTISVGTGSLGGRIHISRSELWMHEDREEYDGDVRKRFQDLFNLSGPDLAVRI